MGTKPPRICPKFVPVERGDISSRSTTDVKMCIGFDYSNSLQICLSVLILTQWGWIYCRALVLFNFTPCRGELALIGELILAQAILKSCMVWHQIPSCLSGKIFYQNVKYVLISGTCFFCILLEELDHVEFYKGNMETDGYSSIYIQRSGQKHDGCGIFYKQNCSELLLEERIEYNDLVNSIQDEIVSCDDEQNNMLANGNENAPKDGSSHQNNTSKDHGDLSDPHVRLKRDCVGIMAAFRLKGQFDHVIVVANTHLYWDPELADVKLAQAKYLLSRLAQFKTLVSHKFECVPSVIVAGDFNSVPNDKVYQYLVSGHSSSAQQEECLEELPIPLCSVYAFTRGEPPFTNCTPDFTDTLDYIFFSPSDTIKPVSILELPEPDSPDVLGCLPNQYHPSDHLPIGAEFEVTRE
ncbi:hypothetical protein JRO89_XS01G0247300 [Xanthoceras sorbifolium]|uniref:Endonuclease/exonuclease/phosphatase domain-containing protein n=1 Tax=Xanthoceras sorbifolium TaxID=99658 RepID=A0ABQ8IL31_9ROSI|nr:hypothetical protein JRO89_XS01G0247300 [Xanthoceras sorbifolium]